ncbi:MAG: SDR family oxidoreductase [Bacteroidota bacterium]|nr:SDR family oxidoreductase [Bacteroidota bacterium]
MNSRFVIFGASGLVGATLFALLKKRGHTVTGFANSNPTVSYQAIDITDFEAVKEVILNFKPHWVINTAAISNIDFAEKNKETTWKINVQANRNLAHLCNQISSRFLYFSSDAVFSGKGGPYMETDPVEPVNYYGFTKKESEIAIMDEMPNATIVRISVVLGPLTSKGNTFSDNVYKKLSNGEATPFVTNEVRTAIGVSGLAHLCEEIMQKKMEGIIHLGATNYLSRYQIAILLARHFGFDSSLVIPIDNTLADKAPRHKNGILDVSLASKKLETPLLTIEEYVNEIPISHPIK